MRECKEQCLSNNSCRYMAYWVKNKRCQTFPACYTQIPDEKNRISVYKRVTPCELTRDYYYERIAAAFPPGILRPLLMPFEWQKNDVPRSELPLPDFYCTCTGLVWMTCAVF